MIIQLLLVTTLEITWLIKSVLGKEKVSSKIVTYQDLTTFLKQIRH